MKRSRQNAEHYRWGENCDAWYLLKSHTLSVIEEVMPPGTAEQLHYHTTSQQLFYVLSGTATFDIDGETVVVGANESLHIQNGIRHRIRNESNGELRFLVISQPPSHDDRVNLSP